MTDLFTSDRLGRYRAFLTHGATDRPLVGNSVGFFFPQVFPTLSRAIPLGRVQPEHVRVDLFIHDIEAQCQSHEEIGDDYPFVGAPLAYVPWMEAIMGCPIFAAENSMWAEPAVDDWEGYDWEIPALKCNRWAQKLLELLEALIENSRDRYKVSTPLMRGPSDILAAMRGSSRFVLDHFDCPDKLRRAGRLCADVWIEVAKAQLARIPVSPRGHMAALGGLRAWAPDRIVWLQEDAMALLSPELYREFVLPLDRYICSQFPYTAFHLHASALWAVDELVRVPEIDILELNAESAAFDVGGTFDAWETIQEHKPLVIWKEFEGDAFWPWLDEVLERLSPAGLSLQFTVQSVDEGLAIKDRILRESP